MSSGVAATIARVLARSWRQTSPPSSFPASDLERVETELLASGAAGLAWWRIRDSPLADTAVGGRLRDAFRLHTLHAALHDERIAQVLEALQEAGLADPPILLKGWSVATRYPARGMRPFGDIDLWVRPDALERAVAAVHTLPPGDEVDLEHPALLVGSTIQELFSRSRIVQAGGVPVRVLSDEDALRVLAVHFLGSGGWRPSGLCDIALAVEASSKGFDIARCVTTDPVVDGWVRAAAGLAHQVLGASLEGTPFEGSRAPRWMVGAVARAWAQPWPEHHGVLLEALPGIAHDPRGVASGLRARWPDPLEATIAMHAQVGSWLPRPAVQSAYGVRRLGSFIRRRRTA